MKKKIKGKENKREKVKKERERKKARGLIQLLRRKLLLGLVTITCSTYLDTKIPLKWNISPTQVFCFCYWLCLKPFLKRMPISI